MRASSAIGMDPPLRLRPFRILLPELVRNYIDAQIERCEPR